MNPGKAYAWVTTGANYGASSDISIFISETFKKQNVCRVMAVAVDPDLSVYVDVT